MTLGGNIVTRNCIEQDYCWREAIQSLLPVCDMISVSDGESTDGTQEEIRAWMEREPKIVLNVYPWPDPKGNAYFFADWLDYNRQHIKADWEFQLDADEILHQNSYEEIRKFIEGPQNRTGVVTRFNFWRDHRHLIPEGVCCGKRVIRLARQDLFLASDGYDKRGELAAGMGTGTSIQIGHYGFIRNREAFFVKARRLQGYFFDTYDPRLEQAEKFEGNWSEMPGVTGWEGRLDPFTGTHPQAVHDWLKAHGYEP